MAQGDVILFDSALQSIGNDWDMHQDAFYYAIVTNDTVPTRDMPAPHWGGTGTTDFSAHEVATGGTSYTGPIALTGRLWQQHLPGYWRLQFDNPATLNQDANGFTDGRWAILFNDTDTDKRALSAVDFGGSISLLDTSFRFEFHPCGFLLMQRAI